MVAYFPAHHDLLVKTAYLYDDPSILGNPAANLVRLNTILATGGRF